MKFLPKNIDSINFINQIKEIGWDVTDLLKSYSQNSSDKSQFRKSLKIKQFKTGPVTSADLEVNEIILNGIKRSYPSQSWYFLSEENKNIGKENIESDLVWIIDPLDGTKDFIKGTGEYAVHISLTYKKKTVIGAVILPSKDELWISIEGAKTFCETRNGKKINLANPNSKGMEDMIIVTSRSHLHPELGKIIKKLKPAKVINMGSIGYKISSILRGETDLYITYSGPNESCPRDWDMAAPYSILKNAGGTITDINSKEIKFLKDNQFEQKGLIIASLNVNHELICKEISHSFLN